MSLPDKINRIILTLNELQVRLNIVPVDNKFYSESKYNNALYVNITYNAFISLNLNYGEWDKSKSIIINKRNIHILLRQMKRYINSFYNENIFALDKGNHIILYSDMANKYKETISLPYSGNSRLVLEPTVIRDENDIDYEGTILYINNTNNYVRLNIDDLECLYYTLRDANIDLLSQSTINMIDFHYNNRDEKLENKIKW